MASTEIIDQNENDDVFSFDKIKIEPENDDGNSEYKLQLTNLDPEKLNKRGIFKIYTIIINSS